jgi:hypothetical protein
VPDRLSEADALTRLRETSDSILLGVESRLAAWTERAVRRILDAWGRADAATRARAEAEAAAAGPRVAARIGSELRTLFALDPEDMPATPLEVVRTAVREPTAILEAAGVPPVERDEFAERSWPADRYGLTPATLGDLTDTGRPPGPHPDDTDGLSPLQLVWGVAKVAVLRARRTLPGDRSGSA